MHGSLACGVAIEKIDENPGPYLLHGTCFVSQLMLPASQASISEISQPRDLMWDF